MSQQPATQDITDRIVSISFADNRIPEFKETRGADYIQFGEGDDFPVKTLMLYNKSAKHNAIINGKVNYINGKGLKHDQENNLRADIFLSQMSKIDGQTIKDIEIFGGFAWEVIPNKAGGYIAYHIDFNSIRSNTDNTVFFYKKDWSDRAEEKKPYPAFSSKLDVPSIFYFKEYRPGLKTYPLPGYIASFNYIEADIEVSKHTLTNAQTGFSASKFINFYNGEPTEENKRDITRRFEIISTGSEGKKILIGFNNDPARRPTIDDLGQSDLTKEDFSNVDNLITNNIFSGAQITHPLLFGIQQEGKLGGATELRTAYEIFKNTYVSGKQRQFEKIINYFAKVNGIEAKFELQDVDPVGVEITAELINENLSREEIRARIGYEEIEIEGASTISRAINSLSPLVANKVLESMTIDEIRTLAGLSPKPGGTAIPALDGVVPIKGEQLAGQSVNENVKNLSAKQHQQLARIIRQYGKEQLTRMQASILLKTGLGFTEDEINGLLGDDPTIQKFNTDDEDELFTYFEIHGESRDTFDILRSKEATFDADDECFELAQAFREVETAPAGGKTVAPPPTKTKIAIPQFLIRYSYEVRPGEGAELLPTSRPFCVRMIGLDRFYSRTDIQKFSGIFGYNVFERVGGYWNDDGVIKKHCRHFWKSNIVVKR